MINKESMSSGSPVLSRRQFGALASMAGAGFAVLAACGNPGATAGGSSANGTLRLGVSFPPTPNLDAGNASGAFWYLVLSYEPLIRQAPDGSAKPALATSWNYIGHGNREFEIHLRDNVKFSDGSPLTADVVKRNIERYRDSAALSASAYVTDVSEITVVDPLTVRLTFAKPDPDLSTIFSDFYAGNMVSGPALDNPKAIATQTFGAGPYILSTSRTVQGDHYTFIRNPHYWNRDAIHFDTVVVKVLSNPNSALAALRTGQVDVITGAPNTDSSAKSADLQVMAVPHSFVGLALADRAGKVLPALGDVRVRQALNYAIDRQKIATGLVDTYGGPTPTEQIVLRGQSGYSDTTFYQYDPAKARRLLGQAGYANGFTLPVASFSGPSGMTPLLQVMANQLADVGVKLQISDTADTNKYIQNITGGQFPAYGIAFGTLPVYLMGPLLFLPNATPFNPFHSSDPQLESLYEEAAAATPATEDALNRQVIARLAEQAWFVPVLFQPVSYYARQKVSGISLTVNRPWPNPDEWSFNG